MTSVSSITQRSQLNHATFLIILFKKVCEFKTEMDQQAKLFYADENRTVAVINAVQ